MSGAVNISNTELEAVELLFASCVNNTALLHKLFEKMQTDRQSVTRTVSDARVLLTELGQLLFTVERLTGGPLNERLHASGPVLQLVGEGAEATGT